MPVCWHWRCQADVAASIKCALFYSRLIFLFISSIIRLGFRCSRLCRGGLSAAGGLLLLIRLFL